MLVLSWNCQGVGRPLTVCNLRELCRVHRPDVVFLMETKNKQNKLESIRRSTCFNGHFYVDPVGRSGGLALWWRDNLAMQVLSGCKNMILVNGSCLSLSFNYKACFIYGPHSREERSMLWRKLTRHSLASVGPFMVIGDFNIIGDISDKQGGSCNISKRVEEFQEFINASNLFDVPFNGLNYTWYNNRAGDANI